MAKKLTHKEARNLLREVEKNREFYSVSGKKIKSVEDLYESLIEMNEYEFQFHRNNNKNDFYNWLKHVVRDMRLANDVARAKTKETTLKRIDERLKLLKELEE